MKISQKMQTAFNQQINAELFSAYLYLSMSAYLETINMPGLAHWMRAQAKEEAAHAMKFYKFIFERRGEVTLVSIDQPALTWKSPLAVFEAGLAHEQKVTKMIDDLVDLAYKEKDKASLSFLQWFVDEQVEEEALADQIVQKLKLVNHNNQGLLMLDQKLGERKDG